MSIANESETVAALTPSDFERLYDQQKAENARLKESIEAARLNPAHVANQDARPGLTAEQGRQKLIRENGPTGFLNATRDAKLRAIGVDDPASFSDDFLFRAFGAGNDGSVGKDLMLNSKARYRQAKEASVILNIYGTRRKS